MDCNAFKNHLADCFDEQTDPALVTAMRQHMQECASCANDYAQAKALFYSLKPFPSFQLPDSGLKQRILNQIEKEEIEMKTRENKRPVHRKWIRRTLAVAASVVFIVTVFLLADRTPFVSTASAAENIMLKSINAMESLRSMFISMQVRTEESENFDFIGTDYGFMEYKFWKQFTGKKPWRMEKPGRTVVFDGEKQYLYLPDASLAFTADRRAGFIEWMRIFLEPKKILEFEVAFSKENHAEYKIEETKDETILTVNAEALGDFRNNYLKNTSILESDNTRKYIFDSKTSLLKTFELYINTKGQSVKVIEVRNIAYNIPVPASTFVINLPQGMQWQELKEPGFVRKFTKISSREAAKRFFTALSKADYETIEPVWDVLEIKDPEKLNAVKVRFAGLEILSLGTAFKSGLYPGEFVPYKIKLKSGEILEHKLAVRNDNPDKTWIVDGGI